MSMRPCHRQGWAALSGTALLSLAASATFAGAPCPSPAPAKAGRTSAPAPIVAARTSAPAPARTLGLMAFIDPETGRLTGSIGPLVPTLDQQAPTVLLEEVPVPGGGWMIDLKGTALEYYVLHVDALGSRRISCVQDARRIVAPPPPPAGPRAEER